MAHATGPNTPRSVAGNPPGTPSGVLALAFNRFVDALARQQRGMESSPHYTLLTWSQSVALSAVAEDGPMRLGTLADRIGTTDGTATRTVDALVDLGLAERVPDPFDGRGVLVAATERGRLSTRERHERVATLLAAVTDDATPLEVARFVAFFDELVHRLDPTHHRSMVSPEQS
jgi:DNA-binding MarR family transcriptional regulator